MGSILSSGYYVVVTGALGGVPSATGVEASAFAGAIAGSVAFAIKMRLGPAKGRNAPEVASQIEMNKLQGEAGEAKGIEWLRSLGETVIEKPRGIKTPFGYRYPDAAVIDLNTGKILYYVEFKTGGSTYTASQRVKDMWILEEMHIPTFVVRV